jgi:hypothetical protein
MSGIILIGFPGIVPFSLSRSSSTSQQTVLIDAAFVSPVALGCGQLCGCSQYTGYLPKNRKRSDSP